MHCDDFDQPSVYREKNTMARKCHKCFECDHPILPGEKYQRVTGLWDGQWESIATCSCCAKTRCALSRELSYGECVPFGLLTEAVGEFEDEFGPIEAVIETVPPESIKLG